MASISSTLGLFNDSLNVSDVAADPGFRNPEILATTSSSVFDNVTTQLSNSTISYASSTIPYVVPSNPSSYLCENRWLPVNHIYFQLANVFLFLSYLAPNGIYGILYLRVTLCVGCFFFSLWGWVILCAFDTFLWNAFFVVINLVHVVVISYGLRPIRFSAELEEVRSLN
ncbi:hypothetical protein HAZT_HAZT004522 [Hyalella azteca]|uniref:POPDC1-3 domain-containing protein n=1 Tax=Hyalella azteca TaxID=294128 RepID=A0A6A0GRJ2_HYAAZ|nr:hypothetical protein HAZT_HAZT004522 [Hyalella azteca]